MQFCRRSFLLKKELEASLGPQIGDEPEMSLGHNIIMQCRWMGAIRWLASSQHALWVGLRAAEEFTLCSVHLPSWVSDDSFGQSVEEALEAGRSKASGLIFLGVHANCNIDDSTGQGIVRCP